MKEVEKNIKKLSIFVKSYIIEYSLIILKYFTIWESVTNNHVGRDWLIEKLLTHVIFMSVMMVVATLHDFQLIHA